MRKVLFALAALLITSSAYAAFGIFQTYLPTPDPRVQKNIVTDYGATCDAQWASRVVTITNSGSGNRDLAVTVNTFVGGASGDVGKRIAIPGAANGNNVFSTTIAAVVDAQHITLNTSADIALSSSTQDLTWGTDNGTNFAAFAAAFQGTTPVQLNLPGNCGYSSSTGGQFPFIGISDFVLAGNGKATSAFVSLGSQNPLFGGKGQYQDNAHSVRTADATAGDSCVVLKTTPAVTVVGLENNAVVPATFTASISGTTMTVPAVASGTIVPGAFLTNANSNITSFTAVQPYGTGGTTGTGGTGTYAVTISQTVSSTTTTTAPASFAISGVSSTGLMTVTSVADGTITPGMFVYAQIGGVAAPQYVMPYGTGGTTGVGGTGTYQLNVPPTNSIGASSMIGNGQIRVELNSTAGLTTGDTLYLTGINGQGSIPQRVNGLQWVKVIDGTHVDLFQKDFNGKYTSGGTGGGDRTSLYPVGSKTMMSGYVLQAYWANAYGFPSNQHWFEYRTVASTNSSTHEVCFTAPLSNTYKAEWPQYNTGTQFEIDPAGPATLYLLDPSWELTHVYKDLTLVVPPYQTTANGRNITWQDVKMYGVHCAIPTQNETHTWINVDASTCSIETDKLVGVWNISGESIRTVGVQSSSMNEINVSGTAVNTWGGSPKKLTLTNIPIAGSGLASNDPALKIGTIAYGVSDETICTNCTISNGVVQKGGDGAPTAMWSMAGGVITIPNGLSTGVNGARETQTRYIIPGHYMFWFGRSGSSQVGRSFKVVSVSQDIDNTYVTTSEAGGFPTGAWSASGLDVVPHPAPKLTVTNGVGPDSLTVFNGCAPEAPMFSCANFTRTGSASGTSPVSLNNPQIWGELDTFTFTNNVPYTNTGSLSWSAAQFATIAYLDTSNVQTFTNFTVNMKLPSSCGSCTRTLTASGLTNGQVGDSLSAPAAGAVFGGTFGLSVFSANTPSDSPQVTVTLRTNQNLPP